MRLTCFNSFHRFSLFYPKFWLVFKKRKYSRLINTQLTHKRKYYRKQHSKAVAQPIILFGQSMTSSITEGILGPTVPSFSLQELKIDIKLPVILASMFLGSMAFSTSFWLRSCFAASSEPGLGPLTYNSSSTEVRKSSHQDSGAVIAGL